MPVTLQIEGLDSLVRAFSALPDLVEGGVEVLGDENSFALIWEWGRITCKPGPKTMYSSNPDGETRVMTITAPHGYIRANRNQFLAIMHEEYAKADFVHEPTSKWPKMAERIMIDVGKRCKEVIANAAPHDTGHLANSMLEVHPGDPLLAGTTSPYFGETELVMPEDWE
jgi:hypothetical protein